MIGIFLDWLWGSLSQRAIYWCICVSEVYGLLGAEGWKEIPRPQREMKYPIANGADLSRHEDPDRQCTKRLRQQEQAACVHVCGYRFVGNVYYRFVWPA